MNDPVKDVSKYCDKHGPYVGKIYINKLLGTEIISACPKCDQEEEEKERQEEERIRKEQQRKQYEKKMTEAGIPYRYWEKKFDTYQAKVDSQRKALDKAIQYAENQNNVLKNGISMILYGKPGTGKTHLAISILHRWETSKKYINARALTRAIRATYGDKTISEQDVIDKYSAYGLLVIDEIGKQFMTDNERFAMFDIINERYNNVKPTILVTNLALRDLQDFLGEDTVDRFRERGGEAIKFAWESARRGNTGSSKEEVVDLIRLDGNNRREK